MAELHLTGLIAAPYTPFRVDGSLHLDVIASMAKLLIGAGVRGVFVCGSTGEGHSLSVDERLSIAEAWVKAVKRRIPVVVHVGHNSLFDSLTLAIQAEGIGADAIASLAPSYYKPRTIEDLVKFLGSVAAAAPHLPFYYYHVPAMTAVNFPVPELMRLSRVKIPTFHGVKFSHHDLMELQECLAVNGGDCNVLFGHDELLLAGLALGVHGAVGSTYNFAAPLYLRIIDAFNKGDLVTARHEQRKSVELVRILYHFGLMPAGKAVMGMLGIDCGPVRPPLYPIDKDEACELYARLKSLDIFTKPLRVPLPGDTTQR